MSEIEKKLESIIKTGSEAEAILNNPLVVHALTAMKGDLFQDFCNSKEVEQREEIHRKISLVDWFVQTFEHNINNGKMANAELEGSKKQFKQPVNII